MSGGRVSILIACYQHGHWLGGALASVFRQTHPDMEAVVVNDGSTDSTASVVREWDRRQPGRVLYVETERVGQARARAAGLEKATGHFYVTLDADDLLEPGLAAAGLAVLERAPAAVAAAGDVWMVDESGAVALRKLEQGMLPGWPRVLESNPLGGVAGILVRTDAARRIGGLCVEGLPGVEDWDFAVRLVRSGSSVARVPSVVARYRQSRSSFSRNPVPMLKARLELLERCLAPDPRLPDPGSQPVLGRGAHHRIVNRHVFAMLGLAAAGDRAAIPEVLSFFKPVEPEPVEWARAFAGGVSHGCLGGGDPRAAVAAVREPLGRVLERAGAARLAPGLAAAMDAAVQRTMFKGPRYWVRRLEAWGATRRFRREGGAA